MDLTDLVNRSFNILLPTEQTTGASVNRTRAHRRIPYKKTDCRDKPYSRWCYLESNFGLDNLAALGAAVVRKAFILLYVCVSMRAIGSENAHTEGRSGYAHQSAQNKGKNSLKAFHNFLLNPQAS